MSISFKHIQPLNAQIGFNINSVEKRIQPFNRKIGFNLTIKLTNSIQCQIH